MSDFQQNERHQQLTEHVLMIVKIGDDDANNVQLCEIDVRRFSSSDQSAARRVVKFRFKRGSFRNVDDLIRNWIPFSGVVANLLMQLDGVYESW